MGKGKTCSLCVLGVSVVNPLSVQSQLREIRHRIYGMVYLVTKSSAPHKSPVVPEGSTVMIPPVYPSFPI
jgi:hypothetical protein